MTMTKTLKACAVAALATVFAVGVARAAPGDDVVLFHPSGYVKLGVRRAGSLNAVQERARPVESDGKVLTVGLRYVDMDGRFGLAGTEYESTAPGSLNEGWGAAYRLAGAADGEEETSGVANAETGDVNLATSPLQLNDACADGAAGCSSAVAVARVGDCLQVTHSYTPVDDCDWAYCVEVNITNLCHGVDIDRVRYARAMDWDVEPTAFEEIVVLNPGDAADLTCLANDRTCTGNPAEEVCSQGPAECAPQGADTEIEAGDNGATFRFEFTNINRDMPLAPGETRTLTAFYGAAPDREEAQAAIVKLNVEAYSLAMPADPSMGPTHFFGFASISGTPIQPEPEPVPVPEPTDGPFACDCARARTASAPDALSTTLVFAADGECA